MKKLLTVLLSISLAFSFAACGSSDSTGNATEEPVEATEQANATEGTAPAADGEKITLTGMVWGSTENHEQITALLFGAYPELAEKYEIEWVIGGTGETDVSEKVRLALSSNEPIADFVQFNYAQVPEFARAGVLTEVGSSFDAYADELLDGVYSIAQYQGETVAFPFELKPRVWFYRADIFEEAGVEADSIKTTDDLIDAGQKIQELYPDSYIWNIGANASPYDFYLTLSGNGANFSDADGNYNISEDAATIAMLEEYKKLIDSGVVLDSSDWTTDWENALNDGTLVSQLSAGWLAQGSFLPTYAAGQEGKWAATTWPAIGGATGGSDAGGSVFVIPSFAQNAEAAADFLSYLTLSEGGSKAIFDVIASTPVNTKTLKHEDVTKPNEFFGDSLLNAQIAALDELKVFDFTPNADAELNIVTEYFIKAVYGEMSIEDALTSAQADMENMIGNAYN